MSDPQANGSSPDQISNVNVDDLLSEITQMADHVETLIGKEDPKPIPPAPEPPPPAPDLEKVEDLETADQLTSEATDQIAEEMQESQELAEDNPEATVAETEDPALEPEQDAQKEIQVDEHTDKLAEDEINAALGKIEEKENSSSEADPPLTAEESIPLNEFPTPARIILQTLQVLDRPFVWLPRPVKDMVGYIGVATFLFAMILWFFVL